MSLSTGPGARFVLDTHLGALAASLRMLGFDTLWRHEDVGDDELARLSREEGRILLSRDRPLLGRPHLGPSYRVEAIRPARQLSEVVLRFGLADSMRPFTRCMRCNGLLRPVAKESVRERVLNETFRTFDEFFECPECGRVYWKGSHYERMSRRIGELRS